MTSIMNISLMIYFALVSLIGTLGNGIILLAYGNRWNSSKSTSVVFILVLACVDLWTCLIVVPTIAIMEYREFRVPTVLCRFYSFSKILIIISSLIMSFIALDRFLNIAVPHYRLLNPRRVKFLLTLFILIGIGLGILTALAFSSLPNQEVYIANYTLIQLNDSSIIKIFSSDISLTLKQENYTVDDIYHILSEHFPIPNGAQLTNINLTLKSSHEVCFADTSIISDSLREVLKHISNKFFFISIGIVTLFYTITFLLALHRQNPRIRALKKSLHVLNKFDSYPHHHHHQTQLNTTNHNQTNNQLNHPLQQRNDSIASYSPLYSLDKSKPSKNDFKHLSLQQYEMSSFVSNDDLEESNILNTPRQEYPTSISEAVSEDLQGSQEKFLSTKQVSFQLDNVDDQQQLAFLSNSFDTNLTRNDGKYYKFPCPCSTTRQLVIKFNFSQPTLDINQWLCYCCIKDKTSSKQTSEQQGINTSENEPSIILTPTSQTLTNHHSRNSETLKRQLYRHRLKQIRMASTFLIITVSFVLFYLPSILTAERIIRSPLMVYYLYLCTHALNPMIYCFMNISLRTYILSMLKCRKKRIGQRGSATGGTVTTFER